MSLFTVLTSLTKVSSVSIVTSLYIFRKEPMFFSLYEYLNPKKIPNDNIIKESIIDLFKWNFFNFWFINLNIKSLPVYDYFNKIYYYEKVYITKKIKVDINKIWI